MRYLTRAEFAKIVVLPFAHQLYDVKEIVLNSDIYKMIVEALNSTNTNSDIFLDKLFTEIENLDDEDFLKKFKVPKDALLEVLYETIWESIF